jgi:hypothetical protein
VTHENRAFFAVDLGTATTSVAMVGWAGGRWRLLGSLALPATTDLDAMIGLLTGRLRAAAPAIAADLGVDMDAAHSWARLVVGTPTPGRIAVLAASERALGPLADVTRAAGWDTVPVSLERHDALAISRVLLDPAVRFVVAGAGEPAAADERTGLGDLGALVAAAATRRPELTVVLAGALAEQLPRFDAAGAERPGDVVLAPPASAGDPPGDAVRAILDGIRSPANDGRRAFARAVATLSEVLDRRLEAIDVGVTSGTRVLAQPGVGGEPPTARSMTVTGGALVPAPLEDDVIDRVLGWSTVAIDRHRLRDRLTELLLSPWADAAGDGALLRLTVGRAALGRLLELTDALTVEAEPDLVVIAGGAWAVAPGPAVALAVNDVLRRPGSRQLALDHGGLLGPLGAIEDEQERRQVVADIATDLLVPLGSVVMPQGLRPGRTAGQLVVHGGGGQIELDLVPGSLELIDLPPGETAVAELRFRETVRLGTRGRRFAVELAGGLGGLLVDLRDVPLRLPERAERRRELLGAWQDALWAGADA